MGVVISIDYIVKRFLQEILVLLDVSVNRINSSILNSRIN